MKSIPLMPAETPELPYSCPKCGGFILQEEVFLTIHQWHMIHGFLEEPHQIPIPCEHCAMVGNMLCTPQPRGLIGRNRHKYIANMN